MVVASSPVRTLGVESGARVRFGAEEKAEGTWAGRRLLFLDEKPAFELSFWCGTCQFLFKRQYGANDTVSLTEMEERLADGVDGLDDEVITTFASLLPTREYLPMLLRVEPRLVKPVQPGDYFSEEQVATWGVEAFWGLPEYPSTPYYRTFETAVDAETHLFEFVVPMVPPSWNDRARVARHRGRLEASHRPTAVAVATLDVCAPAVEVGDDYFAHWGLTHFLLDGHHKLQAAAESGTALQLLSLLAVDDSLASAEQVGRIPALRSRPRAARGRLSSAST
jgi:hypothetical protein